MLQEIDGQHSQHPGFFPLWNDGDTRVSHRCNTRGCIGRGYADMDAQAAVARFTCKFGGNRSRRPEQALEPAHINRQASISIAFVSRRELLRDRHQHVGRL
jgi:hypothetical protein